MNLDDINLVADSVINIEKLVIQLYEVYKQGMTKDKLLQLWDVIAENTEKNVANFNNSVEALQNDNKS
jgi:hypothetical protein